MLLCISLLVVLHSGIADGKIRSGLYSFLRNIDEKGKQRWDIVCFLKTAKFIGMFRLPFSQRLSQERRYMSPGMVIWAKPTDEIKKKSEVLSEQIAWSPMDDVMKGGVSKSSIDPGDAFNGTWSGTVSTANDGCVQDYFRNLRLLKLHWH